MEHKIDLTELTLSLASLMSVTGHTRYSKDKLLEIVSPYFDEVQTDAVGNLMFLKKSNHMILLKIVPKYY